MLELFSKNKRQAPDRRQSLEGVPVLHQGVTIAYGENGNAVLTIRMKRGRGFLARFQPPEMEKVVQLSVPLVADIGIGANWLVAH